MSKPPYLGRPDFIPRDKFRSWLSRNKIGELLIVGGVSGSTWINKWTNSGNPPRFKKVPIGNPGTKLMRVYRPLDIVAKARAHGLTVEPHPIHEAYTELDRYQRELARIYNTIDPHLLKSHEVSFQLTKHRLLQESEIVKEASEYSEDVGVYFLISSRRVVYIGQSVGVSRRVAEHKRNGVHFEKFAYVPCRQDELDLLESLYIHVLQPRLNGGTAHHDKRKSAPMSLRQILKKATA